MEINQLQSCCGVDEIGYISEHGTPDKAMAAFCCESWGSSRYDYKTTTYKFKTNFKNKLQGIYVFTAVIRNTTNKKPNTNQQYGQEFANYIKKMELGEITESPEGINRTHPGHVIKAWFWTPDAAALQKWFKKFLKENPGYEENERNNW